MLAPHQDPNNTGWNEEVTRLEHTGPWGTQVYRQHTIRKDLDWDYKERVRRSVVAKLYESLTTSDPTAEAIAREIMARNPLNPKA